MTLTLAQAAEKIGKSERTVRRMIAEGKVTGEKVSGVWIITDLDGVEGGGAGPSAGDPAARIELLTAQVDDLRSQVEYLRSENQELRMELQESRVRSDTIILRLTDQRKALEDLRLPFWKRWRRRGADSAALPTEEST